MSSFGTLASVPLARPEHVVPRTRNLEAAALHACAIDRVVQYMSANAAEPMRLKVLADIAHCSPWHLDRIFSNATGLSPMRYISLLRINAAKLEIMRSDHRIIEIAYDAGYNSLGSFGKRFTELVGLSPREVRKAADHFDTDQWWALLQAASSAKPRVRNRPFIAGRIDAEMEEGAEGWALIAAIDSGYPSARPVACCVSHYPGTFQFSVPYGDYTVIAIGFPRGASALQILSQQELPRGRVQDVRVSPGSSEPPIDLSLREPHLSDAPIPAAYAVLFQRSVAAQCLP